ncbi:hypothetical protein CALCODRAFT_289030 [Calocera cornea HHB12733]|uniref:Uncharacterized protein n=1 Tax=Calocera cornea HHB12733 TaxID=1353952 RepID=A0A165FVU0_9BASI|nr:hypothetical protein CALCODRAFT_289030 [Calocera cornea HHB12733]
MASSGSDLIKQGELVSLSSSPAYIRYQRSHSAPETSDQASAEGTVFSSHGSLSTLPRARSTSVGTMTEGLPSLESRTSLHRPHIPPSRVRPTSLPAIKAGYAYHHEKYQKRCSRNACEEEEIQRKWDELQNDINEYERKKDKNEKERDEYKRRADEIRGQQDRLKREEAKLKMQEDECKWQTFEIKMEGNELTRKKDELEDRKRVLQRNRAAEQRLQEELSDTAIYITKYQRE